MKPPSPTARKAAAMGRSYIVPGYLSLSECPDCNHRDGRCGEECVCDCRAAQAEYALALVLGERDAAHAALVAVTAERDEWKRLATVRNDEINAAWSQGVSDAPAMANDMIALLKHDISEARAALAKAEECTTCFGFPHASGRVCICRGTNSRNIETEELRKACFDKDAALAKAEAVLGRLEEWTHVFGAALKPPGADTYGEGIRDAKAQVSAILRAALSPKPGEP